MSQIIELIFIFYKNLEQSERCSQSNLGVQEETLDWQDGDGGESGQLHRIL